MTNGDVRIRPATAEDLPALLQMSLDLVAEGCCNGMVPDTLRDWQGREHIVVAQRGDALVGYSYGAVAVSSRRVPGCARGDAFYDLEELYVVPGARDAGVGRLLFDAQEALARQLGCRTMQLAAVSRDHGRLLRFYEQAGMAFWSAWMVKEL